MSKNRKSLLILPKSLSLKSFSPLGHVIFWLMLALFYLWGLDQRPLTDPWEFPWIHYALRPAADSSWFIQWLQEVLEPYPLEQNPFLFRFWAYVTSLATAAVTYQIARQRGGPATGLAAATLLSLSILHFANSRLATPQGMEALLVTMTFGSLLVGGYAHHQRKRWWPLSLLYGFSAYVLIRFVNLNTFYLFFYILLAWAVFLWGRRCHKGALFMGLHILLILTFYIVLLGELAPGFILPQSFFTFSDGWPLFLKGLSPAPLNGGLLLTFLGCLTFSFLPGTAFLIGPRLHKESDAWPWSGLAWIWALGAGYLLGAHHLVEGPWLQLVPALSVSLPPLALIAAPVVTQLWFLGSTPTSPQKQWVVRLYSGIYLAWVFFFATQGSYHLLASERFTDIGVMGMVGLVCWVLTVLGVLYGAFWQTPRRMLLIGGIVQIIFLGIMNHLSASLQPTLDPELRTLLHQSFKTGDRCGVWPHPTDASPGELPLLLEQKIDEIRFDRLEVTPGYQSCTLGEVLQGWKGPGRVYLLAPMATMEEWMEALSKPTPIFLKTTSTWALVTNLPFKEEATEGLQRPPMSPPKSLRS